MTSTAAVRTLPTTPAATRPRPRAATGATARARFWLYRTVVGLMEWGSFRKATIIPLAVPVGGAEGRVRFRSFAEARPGMPVRGLYEAVTFPAEDRAAPRLRDIRLGRRVLALAKWVAPAHTPPVPQDLEAFLSVVYPLGFRRAWPTPPVVPPELARPGGDLLAELAVRAPYGSYLRRSEPGSVADYEIDLRWMTGYRVREGLARPGGRVRFAARDGRLHTVAVEHDGGSAELARTALLAGLNEDLTTFRHNLSVHLTMLTSFALATTNQLGADHPVRRLLHHCFHTVLIGNREVAEFQFGRPDGFSSTIFSHDAADLTRMAEERVRRFDFWDFEPDTQFRTRGTTDTPFEYPYRHNTLRLWSATSTYVEDYLRLYYAGDEAVRGDVELARWTRELDRLVPNGVLRPDRTGSFRWLARLCATLIHVSAVEHDILNNIVWNYSTLGWIIPTVAPESGEPMDQRRAFDLVATIIGTWKPYNMLLTAGIPALALDAAAAAVMQSWIDRLERIQQEMAGLPDESSLSYPGNLNVSISN